MKTGTLVKQAIEPHVRMFGSIEENNKAQWKWMSKVEEQKDNHKEIQHWHEQIDKAESKINDLEKKDLLLDKEVQVSLAAYNMANDKLCNCMRTRCSVLAS